MALARPIPTASDSSGYAFRPFSPTTASQVTGRYQASYTDFVDQFYANLNRWQSETAFISNPDEITGHQCFKHLVSIAEEALQLILDELKTRPSHLVWVLEDAFGEHPYPNDSKGDIKAMSEAWILWADRNKQDV